MNPRPLITLTLVALLAGCGASQADRVATEVAAGIAATQAIERQVATLVAATAAAAAPTPGATPSPSSAAPTQTAAPTEPAATATAILSETPAAPPTNTPAELLPLPTDTPPPTPTLPVAAVLPIGGSTQGLDGSVLVPGYSQAPVPPDAFRDRLAFRVMVRDPAVGQADGEGIERVEFRVQQVDPDGNFLDVYERVEMSAPYCMFSGDDPACNPIDLIQGAAFPNGTPLVSGQYHVEIAIFSLDPEKNAFWNFDFLVELR